MKIAFIIWSFPELSHTFILNQITGLLDLGHDVEIFAFEKANGKVHSCVEEYNLINRVHYLNIPKNKIIRITNVMSLMIKNIKKSPTKIIRSLNVFNYGKFALSLKLCYLVIEFLDKEFDIIQCHFGDIGRIGGYLKEIGIDGKLVTMFHGFGVRLGEVKGANFYRRLFKIGDCFLVNSKYNYKNLIRFGADSDKIILHPVGIDINKFSYNWQYSVKRKNTIKILTVSRLTKVKGLDYGIKSIYELVKNSPKTKVEYRIIGGGSLEIKLKKLVNDLNLSKKVFFLGPMRQEEVIEEMKKAHIFLFPSITEGLGVVLLEAQSLGLPIVATNVGGIPEAVIDGKSGFLVSSKDPSALAERLGYLFANPELWPKMGRTGRKFVEENYNISNLNKRLVKIYEALLKRKN